LVGGFEGVSRGFEGAGLSNPPRNPHLPDSRYSLYSERIEAGKPAGEEIRYTGFNQTGYLIRNNPFKGSEKK